MLTKVVHKLNGFAFLGVLVYIVYNFFRNNCNLFGIYPTTKLNTVQVNLIKINVHGTCTLHTHTYTTPQSKPMYDRETEMAIA